MLKRNRLFKVVCSRNFQCSKHAFKWMTFFSLCGKFREEPLHLSFHICRWSRSDNFLAKLNLKWI